MALLHFDGFETATSTDGLSGQYTVAGAPTIAAGAEPYTGDSCLLISNSIGGESVTIPLSVSGTFFSGFRYRHYTVSSFPANGITIARVMEGSTTHLSLIVSNTQVLELYLGDGTTLLGSGPTLSSNTWYHLDFSCVVHDSTGSAQLNVEDVPVITYSGDTRNGGSGVINRMSLGDSASSLVSSYFDDWYIADSSGSGVTSFLTTAARIYPVQPNGAGDSTDWTPSTGSNWQTVDEVPGNTTDYVSSVTSGHIDLYTVGAVAVPPDTVHAVKVSLYARKDDAATRNIRAKVKSGSTVGTGSNFTLTTSYQYRGHIFDTNPDTGVAWTETEVANMQIGVENV